MPELTSVTLVPGDGSAALKVLDKGVLGMIDDVKVGKFMEDEDIEVVVI